MHVRSTGHINKETYRKIYKDIYIKKHVTCATDIQFIQFQLEFLTISENVYSVINS